MLRETVAVVETARHELIRMALELRNTFIVSQVNLSPSDLPSCNSKIGECGLAILSGVDQTIAPHDAKTIMTILVTIGSPAFELHLCQLEIRTYTFSTKVHPA